MDPGCELEKLLKDKLSLRPEKGRRPVYSLMEMGNTGIMGVNTEIRQGRYYEFQSKDWLDPQDLEQLKTVVNSAEKQPA